MQLLLIPMSMPLELIVKTTLVTLDVVSTQQWLTFLAENLCTSPRLQYFLFL
ncbi:hypothetical protein Hanom_Chr02g00159731 [Helianthus anomalus]